MNKVEMMRKVLSQPAREALAVTRGSHIGAVVQASEPILSELRIHGAIAENDGLTTIGSALAGRLQNELMDSLF